MNNYNLKDPHPTEPTGPNIELVSLGSVETGTIDNTETIIRGTGLETLDVGIVNGGIIEISGGSGSGHCKVLYGKTEEWNARPQLISKKGYIFIYADYKKDEQGRDIAGIKVGNGVSYLIDMPFIDELYYEHINDLTVHITQQEREFWNNKVRCYMQAEVDDDDTLIFTTN